MSKTIELAKQLGLVRYRKLDGSSGAEKRANHENNLKYLFVIDFESTCWQVRRVIWLEGYNAIL